LGTSDHTPHLKKISDMWITIAVVWSALLAGFLLGAWWGGSRRISEMNEYDDVLSRESKLSSTTTGAKEPLHKSG
jgi:hypothetical protein